MKYEVEYDPNYFGGDYNKVGEFVIVSADDPDDVEKAFEKATGLPAANIVYFGDYEEDEEDED